MANENHQVAKVGEALNAVMIMKPSWERHALGVIDRPHGSPVKERLEVRGQGCQFDLQTSSARRRSRGWPWAGISGNSRIETQEEDTRGGELIKVLTNKDKQPPARFW